MTTLYAIEDEDQHVRAIFSTLDLAKSAAEVRIRADMAKGYHGKDVAAQAPELIWRECGESWKCGFIREANAHGYAPGWRLCDYEIITFELDPQEIP